MAYFLKKTKRGNRIYLSIYESFYSPDSKNTRHKSFKKIGFVDKLISDGIDDPISHFQKEVDDLNMKKDKEKSSLKTKQISDSSPLRYLGYVPLCRVLNNLDIQDQFAFLSSYRKFQFDVYDVFTSLVFARAVAPLSKFKTFHDILPCMFKQMNFSYDQLLDCVEFFGYEYEKLVEILTTATSDNYGIDSSKSYFDCTNFYFEIDKESDLQKKGPSKENRHDPIVGMGLLLDSNMIPIGMKIYPGNQSEKPVIRELIQSLKTKNNITGRTIQIADKGLNCAQNIIDALNHNDGYLFSKSVKNLKDTERVWVLLDNDYRIITDSDGSPIFKIKEKTDTFTYTYTDSSGHKFTKTLKEKRVATYNYKLARKKEIEIDRLVNKAKKLSAAQAKKDEYGESGKYINFIDGDGNKARTEINQKAIDKDRELAGYNMLITSEINMTSEDIYNTYHQLWQIEESFRIMKTELDARPVYLQKPNSIKGHFFICYATVLLTRLLQFKELDNQFSASQLYEFMRTFQVVKANSSRYINLLKTSPIVDGLASKLNYPITNYYLTEKQIQKMHTR